MRHVVIGAGGIGRWLTLGLAPTLTEQDSLVIVDGDSYEPHNLTRQGRTEGGKANGMSLHVRHYRVPVEAVPQFVTVDGKRDTISVSELIGHDDTVWLCVDNHATRKAVIEHCTTLDTITLISGGNDDDQGNVIIYMRKDGVDLLPHPFARHPELKRARRWKKPTATTHQASCAARSEAGDGQTLRANMMAAVCMLGAFAHISRAGGPRGVGGLPPCEVYFDAALLVIRHVSP